MPTIRSLPSSVNREEALDAFRPGGIRGALQVMQCGPLRSLAEVYVPFRLYRVAIQNGSTTQSMLVAVDAVLGTLDSYRFERIPDAKELSLVETRNAMPPHLEGDRTKLIAIDRARRQIYSSGFFRLRQLGLDAEWIPESLHVPYWVGFFGGGARARLAVMDAVRRRMEGAKAREFFASWLLS